MNKTQTRLIDEGEKLSQLEERLESYKNKNKERVNEAQEQQEILIRYSLILFLCFRIKKQYDHLKLRCLEQEQRIQQLVTLLNEKQILVDDLNAEKR